MMDGITSARNYGGQITDISNASDQNNKYYINMFEYQWNPLNYGYALPNQNYRNSNGQAAYLPLTTGSSINGLFGDGEQFKLNDPSSPNVFFFQANSGNNGLLDISSSPYSFNTIYILGAVTKQAFTDGSQGTIQLLFQVKYSDGSISDLATDTYFSPWTTGTNYLTDIIVWPVTPVKVSDGSFGDTRYLFEWKIDLNQSGVTTKKTPQYLLFKNVAFGSSNDHTNDGMFYVLAMSVVPNAVISGKVFSDNTNDNTANGTGTNVAAGYVNCVDQNNKVVGSSAIAADGTYQIIGAAYSNTGGNNNYKLILTTNSQSVGVSTLTQSSLASGWVSGTSPTNNSGTGTTSILTVTRNPNSTAEIPNNNFSVHKLPVATDRTITSTVTRQPGGCRCYEPNPSRQRDLYFQWFTFGFEWYGQCEC